MTTTETAVERPPIDMTPHRLGLRHHALIELSEDASTHDDACWCLTPPGGRMAGSAMRWTPDHPAARFTPEGTR